MGLSVLSTRVLEGYRMDRLQRAGITLTQYDALRFEETLKAETLAKLPKDAILIFSSGRAVHAYGRHFSPELPHRAYCVGASTAGKLERLGVITLGTYPNAAGLARLICRERPEGPLVFLSGNLRRDDIPSGLRECGLDHQELPAYATAYNEREFKIKFDGLLFFSPSGVRSFTLKNSFGEATVFCLGNTTAREARQFSKNIVTSPEPDIDLMLELVVDRFSNNDTSQ